MQGVKRLMDGYRSFLDNRYAHEASLYRRLGLEG